MWKAEPRGTIFLKVRAWARKTKAREISSEVSTEKRPLGFTDRILIGKNQDNTEIKKIIHLWSMGF